MNDVLQAEAVWGCVNQMNKHIHKHGEIKPSSQVIKNWHEYNNDLWKVFLTGTKRLIDNGKLNLPYWAETDVEFLLEHIEKCADLTDNVLYPTQEETARLPDAVTHVAKHKHGKTIKSRTFRTMMNVREAVCKALDIDLPNSDDSKGGLDPTPFDKFF